MSDFTIPRITEKRYLVIPPIALTANGTITGLITVSNTYCFKVGQCVIFKQAAVSLKVKIQRVISETQFIVIEADKSIITTKKLDMSSFLIGSTVQLREVKRPVIDLLEIQRQVYEEEPTVALRTHQVDWLGRPYTVKNPMPVQLGDGDVNIGTVNAELEVQLSHQDNVPDAGDVADSVQIGDGDEILEINPDGSINTNTNINYPTVPKVNNIAIAVANTETTFTLPVSTNRFRFKVRDNAKSKISYTLGTSGTVFYTLPPGAVYEEFEVDSSVGVTLYFQTTKSNQVVEIVTWE